MVVLDHLEECWSLGRRRTFGCDGSGVENEGDFNKNIDFAHIFKIEILFQVERSRNPGKLEIHETRISLFFTTSLAAENDARACIKNYITKRLSISCLRGVAVLLKDRFDMPGSIGVEGKQQKKSKNYTKGASYVADRARIENACIKRELRHWSNVKGEEEEEMSREQK